MAAVVGSVSAVAMVPRRGVANLTGAHSLEHLFPAAFGDWHVDSSIVPLEPPADIRQSLAEAYDQTLSRTYVDRAGYRVMLSVAYSGRRNQSLEIHRPEMCYPSQGFSIREATRKGVVPLDAGASLPVSQLVAGSGPRNEPISYWLVIGDRISSFGISHRLSTLKYGLGGRIPDGMLVRVSSIDEDNRRAFAEQGRFVRELVGSLESDFRARLTARSETWAS